jgi:uncharacterized protein YpbB
MSVVKETSVKIDNLVYSYREAERIVIGSDEHLDIILDIQSALKKIIQLSIDVNEELENSFNQLELENSKSIVISLNTILYSSKQFIALLKDLHPAIYNGIQSLIYNLQTENEQIDEFIQDIINYRINTPVELIELLNSIE